MALAGLVIFYGLERLAVSSRQERDKELEASTAPGVFWVHTISFAFYNGLIGYFLLHREEGGMEGMILFAAAMLLHFFVNDYGLRKHHKDRYHNKGRWILSGAVFLGWLVGLFTEVSKVFLAVLLAFLAGGVVLNVLKEELPEDRESRFTPFVLGAVAYAILLLTF